MRVAIVTGAGGLVGAETSSRLCELGFTVLGIDNDMRAQFFGPSASTASQIAALAERCASFEALAMDIRDAAAVDRVFRERGAAIELVVHAAAQPSHDWAASDPHTDFGVNAVGTLNMLEATRAHSPDASFVFTSTNKVYGDAPNHLPLTELETRWELPESHEWYAGVDTRMSIDRTLHSLFGVSKAAADLLVQEYGRYFGMRTVCFRAGCLTGPRHAGARLHGFLSYLMRCTVTGQPYTVYGYKAKQVRDNLHSADLVDAFLAFHGDPRSGAVYNIGGGRFSNCSMLEAIDLCEQIAGRSLAWELSDDARIGDHMWWISDLAEFQRDYPDWRPRYDVERILREIHDENAAEWRAEPVAR